MERLKDHKYFLFYVPPQLRRLPAVLCLFFIAGLACKKAAGPANGKSVQPNNNLDTLVNMNALVNAAPWQTDSAFGYIVHNSGNDSGINNLMVTATVYNYHGAPSTITLNITNFTGPASYPIIPPGNSATFYEGSSRYYARTGVVVISSYTAYGLLGTFNFIADSMRITNGVFNVAEP